MLTTQVLLHISRQVADTVRRARPPRVAEEGRGVYHGVCGLPQHERVWVVRSGPQQREQAGVWHL
jgi:hypothetical protein